MDSKKDVRLAGSPLGPVSRLEVLEGPSGRRVRSEAERARIVGESLLSGAQVSEVARKHGATRWQIYDWRRRFRQRGMLAPCEASQSTFAPLVVESALEEGHVPAIKLEIAISDVVLRTDPAIDGEQLSRVIRAVRAARQSGWKCVTRLPRGTEMRVRLLALVRDGVPEDEIAAILTQEGSEPNHQRDTRPFGRVREHRREGSLSGRQAPG
ncbi:transposase [Bradyrhizobium sp. CAR08]